MAALFAITSAFLYGLTNVFARVGLRFTNTSTGVVISLIACFVSILAISIFTTSVHQYVSGAFFFFLAAGIIGPFLGRVFLYEGISRVGTAISSTLYEDKTLFSVLGAIFILREGLTPALATGIILMMLGTIIVSFEKSGGRIEKKWSKKDLMFPLAAGACYGISHVFRKMGLNVSPEPLIGVMVQNIGAMVSLPLLTLRGRGKERKLSSNKEAWFIFSLIGVLQLMAQWCLFKALELGTVVVVSPLSSLSTFFVLILAALFLRGLERVTLKIVLGAVLMVGATLLLTMKV